MAKEKIQFDFDSSNLLVYIIRKFKVLAIVGGAAFVISAVVSFLITPEYKSTVIMFPTSSVSVSKSLLSKNYSTAKGGLLNFGEEEDAEQLLQVLNSEELSSKIIQKFNLMEHYEIDPKSSYPMTRLGKMYNSHFSFRKTQFMSISVEVLDKDPKLAADMANYAAALVDTIMNRMHKERAMKAFEIVKREYENLQKNMNNLQDSLSIIRGKGVNDYESQSEVFNTAYTTALLRGNGKAISIMENKLAILSKYGSPYLSMSYQLEYLAEQFTDLKAKFTEAKVEVEQDLSYKFIVDSAVPAEKKATPKRMIIILVSTLAAVFMALLSLIILDSVRKALAQEQKAE